MKDKLHRLDRLREQIIIKSRAVNRLSKNAIYSLHRNETKEAKELIEKAKRVVDNLSKIVTENPSLLSTGAFSACPASPTTGG